MHADIVLGQLDKNEALRYMGHRGEDIDEQLDKLITKCEKEVLSCVKPRFVYKVCDISREEKGGKAFFTTHGFDLVIHYVDTIEKTKRGKQKFLIQYLR